MNIKDKQIRGFALLETAMSLLILGLFLGYIASTYELSLTAGNSQDQRRNMHQIQSAMNTFLATNNFLPCPDTDNDGRENRTGNACTSSEGYLPHRDLAVKGEDAWGNPYYYRVNTNAQTDADIRNICHSASVFGRTGANNMGSLDLCPDSGVYYCSNCSAECASGCTTTIDPRGADDNLPPYFHLTTPPYGTTAGSGNLEVFDESADPFDGTNGDPFGGANGNGTAAVAISWGENGDSVYRYVSGVANCAGGTAAELENCDNDDTFVDVKTGQHRDYITWVTVSQAKMALIYNGEYR